MKLLTMAILMVSVSPWLLSASAERIDYCDFIPEMNAGWSSNATLPKFDPEMGTLSAVDLSCEMNLSQELMIENENPEPTNFTLMLSGQLTLSLPSSESLSISFNRTTGAIYLSMTVYRTMTALPALDPSPRFPQRQQPRV